ncbi:single-stranded-DNA-specific exonuclease RecJ [Chloroflexia bacterium SDU3-3]|nr:single-stranded-DNA-specific exonuclease RecJ [Chloroflexia bacterium SDU3-3]
MSARKKRWVLKEAAPAPFLRTSREFSPVVATLLYQRGMRDPQQIAAFLSSDYRSGIHDPFAMKGVDVAASRIAKAIAQAEPVVVYGDFDADGVTAVALLVQALGAMGAAITPYIPHRQHEGYGLNHVAMEKLAESGVKLLITVDCGISNVAEVAHAQALGIDVIVTDHHTPPDVLPAAFAVVNPKQPGDGYPFSQLTGVGIAYKLVQALARLGVRMPLRGRDLLDVVALGTVADLGPLLDENRVLVKAGLESLNTTQRPGLRALIEVAGLAMGRVTATDISFMLGPRLNAAGRLDDAVLAYRLLLAADLAEARTLAEELNMANRRRQEMTREVQEAASEQIRTRGMAQDRVIVLDGAYPAGIVGLVAARLVEEFGRPVLLVERGDDHSRGSARSVPGFSIIDALRSCDDVFVRYGGHSAAAGFTLPTARLGELSQRLNDYADEHLPDDMLQPALEIDAEVPLAALSWDLLSQLGKLEPFGVGNPQPVLMSSRVRAVSTARPGRASAHLKLRLDDGAGGPSFDAIAFRLGHLAEYFSSPRYIDVAYTFEANEWQGQRTLQLNVKDFRRA